MDKITVSIYVKQGISAILIIQDGKLMQKSVSKITDEEVLSSSYLSLLNTLSRALRLVRNFIQENKDCKNVIFELNNSTIIKWFDRCYSKDDYQEQFIEVVNLLQELPIKYLFSLSKKPMACIYTDEKYIEKESVSGIDSLFEGDIKDE